jgi:hypothetical protein
LGLLLVLLAAGLTPLVFHLGQRVVQTRSGSADELEWLRHEFGLDASTLAKVRELHEGYLPQCRHYCEQIAAARQDLEVLLAPDATMSAAAEEKLAEIGSLRARCQTAMLRHFDEVSQAMPPAQGRRYLAEMRRLTLGAHEQIERSMSSPPSAGHDHH